MTLKVMHELGVMKLREMVRYESLYLMFSVLCYVTARYHVTGVAIVFRKTFNLRTRVLEFV